MGIRVKPAISLNEPVAVGGAATEPVALDKIRITAHLVRVLFRLGVIVAPGQHFPIGAPHISPAPELGLFGPLHQIQVVFRTGVDIPGSVDIHRPDGAHDLGELLRRDRRAEGGVDGGDELFVRLLAGKAPHQLRYEVRFLGVVVQGKGEQHLRLRNPWIRESRRLHFPLNGVHGILHELELCLLLCGKVLHHHPLQLIGVDLYIAVKDGDNGHHRHHDDDNKAQHNPAYRL